ncbi:MAG TPA: EAL domain-containing protein [Chromatiales bacterium]|nr:EAL domain-containing protein [Chromatiales bacterium]
MESRTPSGRFSLISLLWPQLLLLLLFVALAWMADTGRPLPLIDAAPGWSDLLVLFALSELVVFAFQAMLWARRFNRLSHAVGALAEGVETEIPWQNRDDDFGRLAHNLTQLRTARRGTRAVIERSRETQIQLEQETTARRTAEDKNLLASTVYAHLDEGVLFCTINGVIEQVNPAFVRLLGYAAAQVEGKVSGEVLMPDNQALHQAIMSVLSRDGLWQGEAPLRRSDGSHLPSYLTCRAIRDEHGRYKHVMGVFQDLSEKQAARARLHELTHHDPLTGLINRASFLVTLREVLNAPRDSAQILLHIGLDRLKAVNDTLGHATGDQLLRQVANRLRGTIRSEDILARLAGDEFAILLPQVPNPEQAESIAKGLAEKLLNALRQPIHIEQGGYVLKVTASIGIALSPRDGGQADGLMQAGDLALISAKRGGRDQYAVYTPALSERIARRFGIEQGLRRALEKNELEVYMQPLVEAGSAQLRGFECLLRWKRDGQTMISPADFIPVAEEIGLIEPITTWLVGEACKHLASWRRATRRELFLSINLSPRHLLREDLPHMLLGALRNNGLDASALMLELTESGLVGGLELVRERIQQLAISGFQIAVDDFGTGHSTLGMLIELPIDKLKIDQSFVRDRIPHDPEAVKVLDAMLALARELQLHVVVEGVETAEQARFIRTRNPQAMLQGYYFDRPTSAYTWDGLLLDGSLPQYEL